MQSQTATITQFNHLLQEILPKVDVFRNQIVESESDFIEFFKNFLKAEGFDFAENEHSIVIEPNDREPDKPLIALKFTISNEQTKNDDIVNLITIIGIISFANNNPALLPVNLMILVEKLTFDSERLTEKEPNDRVALVIVMDSNPLVENDCIAIKNGTLIPARTDFQIRMFSGFVAEGKPESTVDMIAIAAQAITSLSQIATRKLDPLHLAHVSFKDIKTIPGQYRQEVEIRGVIRALEETAWIRMKSIMESTLDAITKSNDCNYEVTFKSGGQVFQNDAEYSQFLLKTSVDILGKPKVQNLEFLNKKFESYNSFFRKFPTVILHVGGLDSINSPNLIPTLQLPEIDKISETATRVICWTLLQF